MVQMLLLMSFSSNVPYAYIVLPDFIFTGFKRIDLLADNCTRISSLNSRSAASKGFSSGNSPFGIDHAFCILVFPKGAAGMY